METELPGTKKESQEYENGDLFYPITLEELEMTQLPKELFPLPEKSGDTAYNEGSDKKFTIAKREYLEAYGVNPSEEEIIIVNQYLILKGIIAWTNAIRHGENHKEFYEYVIRSWNEARLDRIGHRKKGVNNIYQNYFLGTVNAHRLLSNEEFQEVCKEVISDLQKPLR